MEYPTHRQPPQEWVPLLDQWVKYLRIRGCTPATIENWWYNVSRLALILNKPVYQISDEDIIDYMDRGLSANGIRNNRNAFNSFFDYLITAGLREDNPLAALPKVKRDKHKMRPASRQQVEKGLHDPDPTARLMVMMLADLGVRRSELAQICKEDLIQEDKYTTIIIHGKGDKDRILPLSQRLQQILTAMPDGYLFPGRFHGHVHPDTVYRYVKRATGATPHAIRRRFATDLWHATGDAVKVQGMLGHESLATTQAYIYSTQDDLKQAVDQLVIYRQHRQA